MHKNPNASEAKHRTRNVIRCVLVVVVGGIFTGCGLLLLSHEGDGLRDRDQSNLQAIRELLVKDRQTFGTEPRTSGDNALASETINPLAAHAEQTREVPRSMKIPAGFFENTFIARPRQATDDRSSISNRPRSSTLRPSTSYDTPAQWPTVPPYTVYIPVGSAYPGSIRCVPDFSGGQRCHNTP